MRYYTALGASLLTLCILYPHDSESIDVCFGLPVRFFKWIQVSPEVVAELRLLSYLFAPWIWLNEIVDSRPYLDNFALHRADGTKALGLASR
jgi:hypothetical protein